MWVSWSKGMHGVLEDVKPSAILLEEHVGYTEPNQVQSHPCCLYEWFLE